MMIIIIKIILIIITIKKKITILIWTRFAAPSTTPSARLSKTRNVRSGESLILIIINVMMLYLAMLMMMIITMSVHI